MLTRIPPTETLKVGCGDRRSLKAVVFEPAGVLYDATPYRRWLWQLVTRIGLRLPYHEFIRPWDENFLPAVHCGQRPYAEAVHAFLASLGLSAADQCELEAAMSLRSHSLEAGVRPLPGVARGLSRMSTVGLTLAVLCDSALSGNELKEQLDNLGLDGHFGVVITSADLGSVKPCEQNYSAIAATLHLQPHECAMVTGRFDDASAAREHGWRTVSVGDIAGIHAEVTVSTFTQLFDVLIPWMLRPARAAG